MKGLQRQSSLLSALVRSDIIKKEQVADVFAGSQKHKLSIVDYLVQVTGVNSLTIAKMLAKTFGYPLFDLKYLQLESLSDGIRDVKLLNKHQAMPLFTRGGFLYVAMSDPTNFDAIEEIQFNTGLNVEMILADSIQLNALIENVIEGEDSDLGVSQIELEELGLIDVVDVDKEQETTELAANDAPIVVFVNKILLDACKKGASDLHFEPFEDCLRVRFRIDGVLDEITTAPVSLASRIIARLKVMSKLDIAERRVPQDGRIKLALSKKHTIDFRVSTLPTMWGEKMVLRILDSSSAKLGIDILGYEPDQKKMYLQALANPQGMILVTGPTGSGKTVSLYTGLNILNTVGRNISTAEDPVEINLRGVNQVQINMKAGLDFSTALRAFLRQDPDIVMVGEIRDLETAEIAIKAAQTGHLVMSTLHTNSASETLTRLLNMGVPAYNVASSVSLIIAQRLARRLCQHCKIADQLSESTINQYQIKAEMLEQATIFKPVGCEYCKDGYKGRVGIYEVMRVSSTLADMINDGGTSQDINRQAQKEGFRDLRESALMKVCSGVTSLSEVSRVTFSRNG